MILERENESCSPDVSSGHGVGEIVGFYEQSEYAKRAESPPVHLQSRQVMSADKAQKSSYETDKYDKLLKSFSPPPANPI